MDIYEEDYTYIYLYVFKLALCLSVCNGRYPLQADQPWQIRHQEKAHKPWMVYIIFLWPYNIIPVGHNLPNVTIFLSMWRKKCYHRKRLCCRSVCCRGKSFHVSNLAANIMNRLYAGLRLRLPVYSSAWSTYLIPIVTCQNIAVVCGRRWVLHSLYCGTSQCVQCISPLVKPKVQLLEHIGHVARMSVSGYRG